MTPPQPILIETVPAGTVWYRVHRAGHEPLWFGPAPGGPPANRFDDPAGVYRVCYLGASPEAAFAETMLRRAPVRVIARSELAARRLARLRVRREVRLAALYGAGLARAGVTGDVMMALDYAASRAVGRQFWEHPEGVDGIVYQCRHDSEQFAVALFDRAQDPAQGGPALGPAVEVEDSRPLDGDPLQLAGWSRRYRFGVI